MTIGSNCCKSNGTNHITEEEDNFDKELNESVNAPEKATSITEIPENTEDHEECKRKPFLLQVNWRNAMAILCLNVAYCMCSGAYSMMGPFFPEQAQEMGVSSTMVGLIIASSPLTVVFFSPLLGYLLPVIGVHLCIFGGLLCVGLSIFLLGFVTILPPNWIFIFVCIFLRVLEGIGTSVFVTAAYSCIPKLFPNSVNWLVGVFGASGGIGSIVGRPIGGLLYTVGGYKAPFVAVGACVLVTAVPCTLLIRNIVSAKNNKSKKLLPWILTLSISLDLYFITVAQTALLANFALSCLTPVLEPFLIERFNMEPVNISLVFIIPSVTFGVSNIIAGVIADKLKRFSIYVIVFGLLVAVLGEFVIAIEDYIKVWEVWIICVGVGINGAGAGFIVVPLYSNLIRIAERYGDESDKPGIQAFVAGITSAANFLGCGFAYLLGGLLCDYMSLPSASMIVGVVILAMTLLVVGVDTVDRFTWTEPISDSDEEK